MGGINHNARFFCKVTIAVLLCALLIPIQTHAANNPFQSLWCTIMAALSHPCNTTTVVPQTTAQDTKIPVQKDYLADMHSTSKVMGAATGTQQVIVYNTHPVTVVYKPLAASVVSSNADVFATSTPVRHYVTLDLFTKQVDKIYDRLGERIRDNFDDIADAFETASLTLTGTLFDGTNSAGSNGYVLQSTGSGVAWVATSTLGLGGTGGMNSIEDLSDVVAMTEAAGDLLSWNGTAWTNVATSSLGITGSSQWTTSGSDIYYTMGNVGIGTTTPNRALSVAGTVGISGLLTQGVGTIDVAGVNTLFDSLVIDNNNPLVRLRDGAADLTIAYDATILNISTESTANAFNITDSGRVGIGTTTPAVPLDVNGSSYFHGNGTIISLNPYGAVTDQNRIAVTGNRAMFGYNGISANTVVQASASKGIEFNVNNGTFGSGQAAVLTPTGRFGIGTTTPSQELSVIGDLQVTGRVYDSSNSAGSNGYVLKSTGTGFTWVATSTLGLSGATSLDALSDAVNNATDNNIFIGHNGGSVGSTDNFNTVLGIEALDALNNSGADFNTAVGYQSLTSNIGGDRNTALGYQSLFTSTTSSNNTGLGYQALYANTLGSSNAGVGTYALRSNTTGSGNAALGYQALYSNTTGNYNIAVGQYALNSNTTGANNLAMGLQSLYTSTSSTDNIALGHFTLNANTSGRENTVVGPFSYFSNTTGNFNTALGFYAGRYAGSGVTPNTTSDYGVYIGNRVAAGADGNQNEIVIGYNAIGNGSNTATLGNDSIVSTILRGKVGIGTTTPSAQLTIASSTTGFISLGTIGSQQPRILFGSAATTTKWVIDNSVGAFRLYNSVNSDGTSGNVRLTVNSSGKVGIGTTSPLAALHIGGTGELYLGDSGSLGGDIEHYKEMDFVAYRASSTPPSSGALGRAFGFYSSSNVSHLMSIMTNGNVGIGTTTPDKPLTIVMNTAGQGGEIKLRHTNSNGYANIEFWDNLNTFRGSAGIANSGAGSRPNMLSLQTTSWPIAIYAGNVETARFATGTVFFSSSLSAESGSDQYLCIDPTTYEITRGGASCAASSERYKQNVTNLDYGLDTVLDFRPVSFQWNKAAGTGTTTKWNVGFIAEEMRGLVPEVVEIDDEGLPSGIEYDKLTAVLANAMQELDTSLKDMFITGSTEAASSYAALTEDSGTVWSRLVLLAENFVDGMLTVAGLTTDELCVGDTCLTESELIEVLELIDAQEADTSTGEPSLPNEDPATTTEEVIENTESEEVTETEESVTEEGESQEIIESVATEESIE